MVYFGALLRGILDENAMSDVRNAKKEAENEKI